MWGWKKNLITASFAQAPLTYCLPGAATYMYFWQTALPVPLFIKKANSLDESFCPVMGMGEALFLFQRCYRTVIQWDTKKC